jgi:5-hydroxyisourate hydrolase
MSGISTHILDTALGTPAAGIAVTLERWQLDAWLVCASSLTDADGRINPLFPAEHVTLGRYRLNFLTAPYFATAARPTFFPEVSITFDVERDGASCHVPLLLSGFGFSTYRGS